MEDTLPNEILAENEFSPEYFQKYHPNHENLSYENTIDDYYKIEPSNLRGNQTFQLMPITNIPLIQNYKKNIYLMGGDH